MADGDEILSDVDEWGSGSRVRKILSSVALDPVQCLTILNHAYCHYNVWNDLSDATSLYLHRSIGGNSFVIHYYNSANSFKVTIKTDRTEISGFYEHKQLLSFIQEQAEIIKNIAIRQEAQIKIEVTNAINSLIG